MFLQWATLRQPSKVENIDRPATQLQAESHDWVVCVSRNHTQARSLFWRPHPKGMGLRLSNTATWTEVFGAIKSRFPWRIPRNPKGL